MLDNEQNCPYCGSLPPTLYELFNFQENRQSAIVKCSDCEQSYVITMEQKITYKSFSLEPSRG